MADTVSLPVQGVLFDLDGVLCNSEPYHHAARAAIAEKLGVKADDVSVAGMSTLMIYERMIARSGGGYSAQALSARHYQLAYRFLRENSIGPMEGLPELLEYLRRREIPYGVVSSSCRWYVEQILNDFHMYDGAVCVVTAGDGLPLKPEPDMYLAGAAAFSAPVTSLLAVEDSYSGVTAAKAAGLNCAALHNPDAGNQNLTAADLHLTSLSQLPAFLDGSP